MKILILYTVRSGTNSIASYFLKQNPQFEYFNQPFTTYIEEGIRSANYTECIKYENVLVKSEIQKFDKLNINKETILNDFDKVLLISRKNKKEQAISRLIAQSTNNFLDKSKRPYYIENIDNTLLEELIEDAIIKHNLLETYISDEIPLFYYEDLYYGDFTKLFQYLNVKHIDTDFNNILDIKNRYKDKELHTKKGNTLI